MKITIARSLILGAALSLFPGIGAVVTQTEFLSEPVIAKAAEWEPIRTHEVTVNEWWELEYGNDPDIPDDIEEASIIAGLRYTTAPELYQAIGETESHWTVDAENGQYKGWLQVGEKWHAGRLADLGLEEGDLMDPYVNALVAADYLAELMEKYEGDLALILMAYNGDASGMRRYYQTGKASYYARTILERSAELERKHGK